MLIGLHESVSDLLLLHGRLVLLRLVELRLRLCCLRLLLLLLGSIGYLALQVRIVVDVVVEDMAKLLLGPVHIERHECGILQVAADCLEDAFELLLELSRVRLVIAAAETKIA